MQDFINKILIITATTLLTTTTAHCQEVIFTQEKSDTTKITEILLNESSSSNPGNVTIIAENFINTPYAAGTLEGAGAETLRVNLDSMDCTTFVETVMALASTANEHRYSWRDFIYNLRSIRYRNGEIDGYPSRLNYVSDWIVDNVARGNLQEITADHPKVRYRVKSLDYMTTHRDRYPALADNEENYTRMKSIEAGFSNHRYPYIKASGLKDNQIARVARDGDIIVFTTSIKGLDATHMGIVKMVNGTPKLLHASSKAGKVVVDELSISDYIHRNRPEGIRLLRLTPR